MQVAGAGAGDAAGDGGVDDPDPEGFEAAHRVLDGCGADGGHDEHHGVRGEDLADAALTEEHGVELGAGGDHDGDDVGAAGRVLGRGRRGDVLGDGVEGCRGDLEGGDGHAGSSGGEAHGGAHGAEADPGDGGVCGHDRFS